MYVCDHPGFNVIHTTSDPTSGELVAAAVSRPHATPVPAGEACHVCGLDPIKPELNSLGRAA